MSVSVPTADLREALAAHPLREGEGMVQVLAQAGELYIESGGSNYHQTVISASGTMPRLSLPGGVLRDFVKGKLGPEVQIQESLNGQRQGVLNISSARAKLVIPTGASQMLLRPPKLATEGKVKVSADHLLQALRFGHAARDRTSKELATSGVILDVQGSTLTVAGTDRYVIHRTQVSASGPPLRAAVDALPFTAVLAAAGARDISLGLDGGVFFVSTPRGVVSTPTRDAEVMERILALIDTSVSDNSLFVEFEVEELVGSAGSLVIDEKFAYGGQVILELGEDFMSMSVRRPAAGVSSQVEVSADVDPDLVGISLILNVPFLIAAVKTCQSGVARMALRPDSPSLKPVLISDPSPGTLVADAVIMPAR